MPASMAVPKPVSRTARAWDPGTALSVGRSSASASASARPRAGTASSTGRRCGRAAGVGGGPAAGAGCCWADVWRSRRYHRVASLPRRRASLMKGEARPVRCRRRRELLKIVAQRSSTESVS